MVKHLAVPLLAAALVGVTACGSDSAGSADVDAFCDMLRESEAAEESGDQVDLSEDFDAGMAELQRFRDAAPGEIRDDIDTMIGLFRELDELEQSGADDEEAFGAALALMFDPRFLAAAENLETFGVETCGLEPSDDDFGFDVEGDDGAISFDDDADGSADESEEVPEGFITEPADIDDPLWSGGPFDDPIDPSEASYHGAQYFLDTNYADAPWRTRLGSWTSGGALGSYRLAAGGVDVTTDEAQEICAALVEYLRPLEPDAEIEVETYTQNDDGSYNAGEVILSGTVADGC